MSFTYFTASSVIVASGGGDSLSVDIVNNLNARGNYFNHILINEFSNFFNHILKLNFKISQFTKLEVLS